MTRSKTLNPVARVTTGPMTGRKEAMYDLAAINRLEEEEEETKRLARERATEEKGDVT